MAYNPSNLSALVYANGHTQWHYRTGDPWTEVMGEGYFDPAASMLRIGDLITLNTQTQHDPIHTLVFVTGNSAAGRVTIREIGSAR